MKIGLIIGAIFCIGTLSLEAAKTDALFKVFKKAKKYPKDTHIGFELVNKSGFPLWFSLKNGEKLAMNPEQSHLFRLENKASHALVTDIYDVTTLAIWYRHPPVPPLIFKFTPEKTIYVTFRSNNTLTPETGTFKGLLGKTDSNLSLENNVKQSDIQSDIRSPSELAARRLRTA